MDTSNNPFEPQFVVMHSGELRLKASETAAAAPDGRKSSKPALEAISVRRNARERVLALGGAQALKHNKNILSQYVLQFGRYRGQSFKWVLENDLGWVTGILSDMLRHGEKESNSPLSHNKFRLLQYAEMYPKVLAIVKEKEAQRKAPAAQVSMPTKTRRATTLAARTATTTATTTAPSADSEDLDLAEACREIEDMEILSGRKCSLFTF
jgi:hypothetical protein